MAREIVKEAATVEEAVAAACEELGIDAAAAKVEVLAEPQKKVLGLFGGAQARSLAYGDDCRGDGDYKTA